MPKMFARVTQSGMSIEQSITLVERFQQTFPPLVLGDDGIGGSGPLERLRIGVVGVEVFRDCLVEFDDGAKDPALQAALGQGAEQAFDGVQPRRAGRGEVDVEPGVAGQPVLHRRGLVGGVVVEDGVAWDSLQRCTLRGRKQLGPEPAGAERAEALAGHIEV